MGARADRLTPGEWVAAAGGAVLVLSLFGPWAHRSGPPALARTYNGWRLLGPIAAALVGVAAVPLWHAVRRLQGRRGLRPLAPVCAGAVGFTLVLFGMANRLEVSFSPQWGLYLGLVSTGAIVVGGSLHLWRLRPPSRPPGPPS